MGSVQNDHVATPDESSARVAPSSIILVPWDPESADHVERLRQQRVECGWKQDDVEKWRPQQRQGLVGLHWVVLNPSHPSALSRLQTHVAAYPNEVSPLQDTATEIFSRPRKANLCSSLSTFTPVGHISLDAITDVPELLTSAENGIYSLCALYISRALHNGGLGGLAIKAIEEIAANELGAVAITLDTIDNSEVRLDNPRDKAMGYKRVMPKVTNADWYGRKGYVQIGSLECGWTETDPTGKVWPVRAVVLRKDLKKGT